MHTTFQRDYHYYKNIFKNVQKPFAYIDLDYLDENIKSVLNKIQNKKNIRLATKSIRSAHMIDYLLKKIKNCSGLMSYDANETLYLLNHGFDHILLGYPVVDPNLIENLILQIQKGKNVCFMVDDCTHVQILEKLAKKHHTKINICLDVDLSQTYPFLHFGIHRSSIHSQKSLHKICTLIKHCQNVNLHGVMGYEAQIAGLEDHVKNNFFKNMIVRFLKNISVKKIKKLRHNYLKIIQQYGFNLNFVNGGGSGSIATTRDDPTVTEITIGSAFYSPHFLDNFYQSTYLPAAGFAIEITRKPKKNIFTAHGGGYHSSGSKMFDKTPKIYLPDDLKLISNESAGEVQTPFLDKANHKLEIGDPIFMRHAKAGEMCERFNKLYLISNGTIQNIVTTYRGDGICTL